jgi:hypothetical protein
MIPRIFKLWRLADETGISGVGLIAEGALFSDGTCALRWLTTHASTAVYKDLATLVAIHGHGGTTQVRFPALTVEEKRDAVHFGAEGGECLPCCLRCHHPVVDHWGDNCGACMSGPCDCVLMNHPERLLHEART